MLIIRQVEVSDLEDLLALANKAGKGMTSLPTSEEALSKKINNSRESFSSTKSHKDDFFFLALEDTQKGKVIGTASVHARTGSRQAFYAYRVMPVTHYSHSLEKQVRAELLHLTNDYTDHSEVGSLFVDPDYRGNGRWLATSRYLLMGQFPERFAKHVIAELRGIVDEDGISPFWESIGRNFFHMEYGEADALCGTGSNQFITELMPKHPIYTCFLSQDAQSAIGTPNKDSKRAMEFLQDEGYDYENVVDIFDGGPIMRAKIKNIKSVRSIATHTAITNPNASLTDETLIANTTLNNFRVVKSQFTHGDSNDVILPQESFEALQIKPGDTIRLIQE
ncbi:arginine N-succinyltransferase [Agarilytica rhodophyticola]|uniref:arginine N-succinyltransferase n=1 Tax=Agarilytica rhodophyticola TaxID=1737490 RepID=UPI000B3488D7|nr:arginine N-succinyltransferase [Agarilytica rhodophyticola]